MKNKNTHIHFVIGMLIFIISNLALKWFDDNYYFRGATVLKRRSDAENEAANNVNS